MSLEVNILEFKIERINCVVYVMVTIMMIGMSRHISKAGGIVQYDNHLWTHIWCFKGKWFDWHGVMLFAALWSAIGEMYQNNTLYYHYYYPTCTYFQIIFTGRAQQQQNWICPPLQQHEALRQSPLHLGWLRLWAK